MVSEAVRSAVAPILQGPRPPQSQQQRPDPLPACPKRLISAPATRRSIQRTQGSHRGDQIRSSEMRHEKRRTRRAPPLHTGNRRATAPNEASQRHLCFAPKSRCERFRIRLRLSVNAKQHETVNRLRRSSPQRLPDFCWPVAGGAAARTLAASCSLLPGRRRCELSAQYPPLRRLPPCAFGRSP